MINIKVVGRGCPNCAYTYRNTKRAVKAVGVEAEVVKVQELVDIVKLGVMNTPALVVEGEIVAEGYVPSEDEVKEILQKYKPQGHGKMDDKNLADVCNALSNEVRVKIIRMLSQEEKFACELLEELNISQPTLSYHMKTLSDCKLIRIREKGKWKYYSLNCCMFRDFKSTMSDITCTKKVHEESCMSENSCSCENEDACNCEDI